jgi:hypothetical protein
MKRNILVLLFAAVLAFAFSFGFLGCKKEAPEGPAVEEKKDQPATPAEEKKEEEKKE